MYDISRIAKLISKNKLISKMAEFEFEWEYSHFSFSSVDSFRKRVIPLILLFLEHNVDFYTEIDIRLDDHNIILAERLWWTFVDNEMAERALPIIKGELPYYPIIKHLFRKEYIEKYSEIERYRTIPKDYKLAIAPAERWIQLVVNDICLHMSDIHYCSGGPEDHRYCCHRSDCETCYELYSQPPPNELAQQVFDALGISYKNIPEEHSFDPQEFNWLDVDFLGEDLSLNDMNIWHDINKSRRDRSGSGPDSD